MMPTLPRRDLEALLWFVHDAATSEGRVAFTPALLAELQRLVPRAERVSYAEIDAERETVAYYADEQASFTNARGSPDFWHLRHQHVLHQYFLRTGDLRPRMISDVVSQRAWRRRELYNVVYRPYQYNLDFRLPAPTGRTKTFLFHASRRPFTERDRFVLELLQPHLHRLEERILARGRMATYAGLTPREAEVLGWVSRGKTNAEIGAILWISPGTVRKHLENAYRKLGVRTRTAAVARLTGLNGHTHSAD